MRSGTVSMRLSLVPAWAIADDGLVGIRLAAACAMRPVSDHPGGRPRKVRQRAGFEVERGAALRRSADKNTVLHDIPKSSNAVLPAYFFALRICSAIVRDRHFINTDVVQFSYLGREFWIKAKSVFA